MAESLNREEDFDVVARVSGYHRLIEVVERTDAEVALIDPERIDGDCLTTAGELRKVRPQCRVVLTVDAPTRTFVDRALRAGVLSIVPKSAGLRRLIESVRGVASGQVIMDPRLLSAAGAEGGPLTDREADVLRLTASGASVKEMAEELYLSAGTIRNLASAAIKKLDARNRYDAVRIATERCWI
ncbi:response regulator transcription factor [Streptomyces sp. Li-HN-5-11]|uniref:response regulator transcription factor n=1 Tax=Streptomyces sp. Li-HN-5-11 TaxID=3075432 RepID=UPI0028A75988|nr:response regulator transcription factor [Streptomyces sp. Li-HN-5-11]WNM34713.1 response regulator transcription factor [Streptomyces sp. Li-HN-5-11]